MVLRSDRRHGCRPPRRPDPSPWAARVVTTYLGLDRRHQEPSPEEGVCSIGGTREEAQMATFRGLRYTPVSAMGDPDDFRPNSRLGFAVDPGDEAGCVQSLCLIFEVVGPGDAVGLHRHP